MIQNIIVFLIFSLAVVYLVFYLYRKLAGRADDCACGCSGCPESAVCPAQSEWQSLKKENEGGSG